MKRRGRLLSLLLVICLAAGMMPTTASAVRRTSGTSRTAASRAAGTKGAVQIVNTANPTGGIRGYDDTQKDEPTKGYNYIYYGIKNGVPLKWRVLDVKTNGGASGGIFLLSEELQGETAYDAASGGGSAAWDGSSAQDWCKAFADPSASGTTGSPFTDGEAEALLAVTGGLLTDEKVFFLSEAEAGKQDYGLDTDQSRVAEDGGTAKGWWLRTPGTGADEARAVGDDGAIGSKKADSDLQARPAFNLNMDRVLFTAPAGVTAREADGLKKVSEEAPSEWRLVLKDDGRNDSGAGTGNGFKAERADGSTGAVSVNTGEKVEVKYENAKSGTDEYISAMIADGSGNILYYGQVSACGTAAEENGTAEITVPADLAEGDYTIRIFNEKYAGPGQTGYASDMKGIDIKVTDTIPPALTEEEVKRISDTEAEITFTSSEAGSYYYKVVEEGAAPPSFSAADLSGTGTLIPADALTQTFTINGLTLGKAYDVYIVAKDAKGNANNTAAAPPLKLTVPMLTTPVYEISVDPGLLSFRASEGYAQLPGEKLTVKNTGNQKLTLAQPVSWANSNYEIGALSKTELAPGESAEFTVSPKTGLPVGSYQEKITVSGSSGSNTAEKEVSLNFEVKARTPGKYVITATAGEGGSISPGSSTVDPGADLTVTITPLADYAIDTVTVDGAEVAKSNLSDRNEYTFRNIQADHTIHVTFRAADDGPAPAVRTLKVSASPEAGGKAEVPGGGTSGTFDDGSEVIVTAAANAGYHFVRWTENDSQVSDSASYKFNIAADRNLVAVFAADTPAPASHTVTVNSSYAQTSGAGTYAAGATVTIQAGARQNYRFDGWTTEDGVAFANAASATTTFTMPDKNVTVAAKWTYTGSSGTGGGTNSGNNGTTSGNNNTNSGGSGTVSDGKGGTYTGDDTPTALWMSALCTSFGLMAALGILGWRRRKPGSEFAGQWIGLTEKEFGQKRK